MRQRKSKYDEVLRFEAVVSKLLSLGITRSSGGQREYLFVCECGAIVWVSGSMAARKVVMSCGCYGRDVAALRCKARKKHGLATTSLYKVWRMMLTRCYDITCKSYRFYGARGVSVCNRWHDLQEFYADVSPLWVEGLQMDRIDTYGDYEPGNVRFITPKENQRNRRDNRLLQVDGVTKCAAAWAEDFGIRPTLLLQRIDRDNMSPKQALTYKKNSGG